MKAAVHIGVGILAIALVGYGFLTAAAGGMSDNPLTAEAWSAAGFAMFVAGLVACVLNIVGWFWMRPQKPGRPARVV